MEECGRGAAVEQLTARGMEYQSPRWGAIVKKSLRKIWKEISIPAMGGNRNICLQDLKIMYINPRNGGAIATDVFVEITPYNQSPQWGGNSISLCPDRAIARINPRNGGQ